MYRILFASGDFVIYSYSVALALAFAAGLAMAIVRAPQYGIGRRTAFDGGLILVLSALVGSHVPFLIGRGLGTAGAQGATEQAARIAGSVLNSGATVLAGVAAALLAAVIFYRFFRVSLLSAMDLAAPSVALGQGVGRIGCFMAGCCHGNECALPWAVRYPDPSWANSALGDVPVHPSQLYAVAFGFALSGFLLWLSSKALPKGALMATFLLCAGSFRILLDTTRHYPVSNFVGSFIGFEVTKYQLGALGFVVVGAVGLFAAFRWSSRPKQ